MRRHIWSIRPKQKRYWLLKHSQARRQRTKEAVSSLAAKLNDFLAQIIVDTPVAASIKVISVPVQTPVLVSQTPVATE
ncbi:hypothetical protein [Paenibacillus polymyxa]|uniref:hypothetical protein n=1 Tax=Paenibacillus polymyxa TaxID=1406 RepID=UPI0021AD5722|nr:hypothetical protein [Paenibacillus polymyxa]